MNMNAPKNSGLEKLISQHGNMINFGSSSNAVSEVWLSKAEAALGRPLTNSYKWFLKNYAGGDIGGEEIYSIYGLDFELVNGGDIVFQHFANRKASLLDEEKLAISETDFGEVFCFDYSQLTNGECPILVRLPSGEFQSYAEDFYDFLRKRIEAHL
jgi:antitoxin YobK